MTLNAKDRLHHVEDGHAWHFHVTCVTVTYQLSSKPSPGLAACLKWNVFFSWELSMDFDF